MVSAQFRQTVEGRLGRSKGRRGDGEKGRRGEGEKRRRSNGRTVGVSECRRVRGSGGGIVAGWDRRTVGSADGLTDGRMDGWMDGWMDGRMEGWTDRWTDLEGVRYSEGIVTVRRAGVAVVIGIGVGVQAGRSLGNPSTDHQIGHRK